MDISEAMVRQYLADITVSYFNDADLTPVEVSGYEKMVLSMKQHAASHGELPYLKLAIQHLLTHPEIPLEPLGGGRYPYDDEELREILLFAWNTIWPGEPVQPDEPLDVKLVRTSIEQWRKQREPLRSSH